MAMNLWRKLLLFCLLTVSGTLASADELTFGDYTVHYIAVNSTFLTPEIAEQYNIVRADRRAFLNIAVLHNEADGTTTPVTAALNGIKHNLLQQSQALDFTEIREGDAIYYIGQFDFSNAEILRFTVEVHPEGREPAENLEWSTQLYSD